MAAANQIDEEKNVRSHTHLLCGTTDRRHPNESTIHNKLRRRQINKAQNKKREKSPVLINQLEYYNINYIFVCVFF